MKKWIILSSMGSIQARSLFIPQIVSSRKLVRDMQPKKVRVLGAHKVLVIHKVLGVHKVPGAHKGSINLYSHWGYKRVGAGFLPAHTKTYPLKLQNLFLHQT